MIVGLRLSVRIGTARIFYTVFIYRNVKWKSSCQKMLLEEK